MHPELGPTWPGGRCHWAAMSQVLMAGGCILMEAGLLFPPEWIEPAMLCAVHDGLTLHLQMLQQRIMGSGVLHAADLMMHS